MSPTVTGPQIQLLNGVPQQVGFFFTTPPENERVDTQILEKKVTLPLKNHGQFLVNPCYLKQGCYPT